MNRITTIVAIALMLGVGGYVAKLKWDNTKLRRERNELALTMVNQEAEHATQQRILIGAATLNARLATQRAAQVDSLDRLLGVERRAAEADIVVSVDTAVGADTGQETGPTSAHFDIRHEPFTITLDVAIAPPAEPTIDYNVVLDPARLRVRVGCEGENSSSAAQRARVSVLAPTWLRVKMDEVNVEPNVCNRRLLTADQARSFGAQLVGPAIGAAVGAATAAIYGDRTQVGTNLLSGALLGAATGFLVDQLIN